MIVILLLTFLMFEAATRVLYCLNPPLESYNANFDLKAHMAEQKLSDAEHSIVFLGDSLTERAVYPEYLQMLLREKGIKTDITNLATGAASPQIALDMLQHRVKKQGKPSLVVINVTFRWFHQYWQTRLVKGKNSNQSMQNSYMGQCEFNSKKSLFEKVLCSIKKNSLLVRHPELVRDFIYKYPSYLLGTNDAMNAYREDLAKLPFNRGWVPNRKIMLSSAEYQKFISEQKEEFLHFEKLFPDVNKKDWYTEQYIEPLIKYCRQNNIAFIMTMFPEAPVMAESFYPNVLHVSKQKLISMMKQYLHGQGVMVWDFNQTPKFANIRYFADSVHFNVLGAIAYNEQLSQLIYQEHRQLLTQKAKK